MLILIYSIVFINEKSLLSYYILLINFLNKIFKKTKTFISTTFLGSRYLKKKFKRN
jgi:hypothetical protein